MVEVEKDEDQLRRELNVVIEEQPDGPKVLTKAGTAKQKLDIRPIYAFEEDILETLISTRAGISLTSGRVGIKGRWIHGWLDKLGEDYISSIWRGYQFFTKYVEVKTAEVQNVATFNRNPGSYDSMYRYILVLEDLELVDRVRSEQAPQSEFDSFVPANIRIRTFVENTASYEGNERFWDNPFKQAYPDDETDSSMPTPDSSVSDELEPVDGVDSTSTADDSADSQDGSGQINEAISNLGEATDSTSDVPDEDATVTDLPDTQAITALVQSQFSEAVENAFSESPFPIDQVEPEDFSLGRVAAFGPWAAGTAVKGQTSMQLVVSVDNSQAETSPGFIPAGIGNSLGILMRENNTLEDVIPNYVTVATYDSEFHATASDQAQRDGSSQYYSFALDEFVDV